MMILVSGLVLLTGCSVKQIKPSYEPTKPYARLDIPTNPTRRELADLLTECVSDRELLYDDFDEIIETEKQMSRKWWQFWK